MTTEQTAAQAHLDTLKAALAKAEQVLADTHTPTAELTTGEVLALMSDEICAMRAGAESNAHGFSEELGNHLDGNTTMIIEALNNHAETLRELAAAHAGTINDELGEFRKTSREAIGQHRLTAEQTTNALAATVRDGCNAIALALKEGLQRRP